MVLRIILVFTVIHSISGCYQRRDGCLDQLASNYSISADDACTGCCSYPNLVIDIIKKNGLADFDAADTLVNALNQTYQFIEAKFYVSMFSVSQGSDMSHHIRETIVDSVSKDAVIDDIKIINFKESSKILGTMRATGIFERYTFLLGIDASLADATFNTVAKTHPLHPLGRLQNADGDLIQAYFSVVKLEAGHRDTLHYYLPLDPSSTMHTITFQDTTNFGAPIHLPMMFDMSQIFNTVDLSLDPSLQIDVCNNNFKGKFLVK